MFLSYLIFLCKFSNLKSLVVFFPFPNCTCFGKTYRIVCTIFSNFILWQILSVLIIRVIFIFLRRCLNWFVMFSTRIFNIRVSNNFISLKCWLNWFVMFSLHILNIRASYIFILWHGLSKTIFLYYKLIILLWYIESINLVEPLCKSSKRISARAGQAANIKN